MRILVRLLSSLLGLVIAAAGVLLAVESVWAWIYPAKGGLVVGWRAWQRTLSGMHWNDQTVQLIAGGVLIVGLLLLIISSTARRGGVRFNDPSDDVSVTTSPRSLARIVGHRVRAEDGVSSASVSATARKVKVRATSQLQREGELRPRLREITTDLLGTLP
ncbi:MAG: DUF6286 domain-containing protein, partial [Sciscionella sp.]